jgi:hypothetical protein
MKTDTYPSLTEKKKEWELMRQVIEELITQAYNYRKYKVYMRLSGLPIGDDPTFGEYLFGENYK